MKKLSPNDFGKKYLVEDSQRIRIADFIKQYKTKLKELIFYSELEVLGVKTRLVTTKTTYNGIRFWFQCPVCQKRIGTLYKHPMTNQIGCRSCLNLDYRQHRYKGMMEEGKWEN